MGFPCWVSVLTQTGGVRVIVAASHFNRRLFLVSTWINRALGKKRVFTGVFSQL